MKTSISREYQIISKKAATVKSLREAGFSISHNEFIRTGSLIKGKTPAETIALLCKQGRLKRTLNVITNTDENSYYKGWLKNKILEIHKLRETYAIHIAESYHANIRTLYTSERAGVTVMHGEYNSSRAENIDWNAYAKSYHHPAKWKDAAVVINKECSEFSIYTSRGTEVAKCPIPSVKEIKNTFFGSMLINGDLFSKQVHANVYIRHDKAGKKTGYAVRLQRPLQSAYYYEHGKTIREIKQEYAHKLEIAIQKSAEEKQTRETARAARLINRLVKKAIVTYQDARAVGFCNPGIEAFCSRVNIQFSEDATATLGFLQKYRETTVLCNYIANKLAQKLILK